MIEEAYRLQPKKARLMKTEIQTLARAYNQLCEGEGFRIAIGNFMNEFFLYNTRQRHAMLQEMNPEERAAYIAEYNARVPVWMRITA
jgi:hypothetical protein